MVRPQGSEATDNYPDGANAELYDEIVWKIFEKLDIEWKVIEEHLVVVVSDGASTMGAYVDRLNAVRESVRGGANRLGKGCSSLPDAGNEHGEGKCQILVQCIG